MTSVLATKIDVPPIFNGVLFYDLAQAVFDLKVFIIMS